jgi:hypothetical protein
MTVWVRLWPRVGVPAGVSYSIHQRLGVRSGQRRESRMCRAGTTIPTSCVWYCNRLGSEVGGPRIRKGRPDDLDCHIRMRAREAPGRADRVPVELKDAAGRSCALELEGDRAGPARDRTGAGERPVHVIHQARGMHDQGIFRLSRSGEASRNGSRVVARRDGIAVGGSDGLHARALSVPVPLMVDGGAAAAVTVSAVAARPIAIASLRVLCSFRDSLAISAAYPVGRPTRPRYSRL